MKHISLSNDWILENMSTTFYAKDGIITLISENDSKWILLVLITFGIKHTCVEYNGGSTSFSFKTRDIKDIAPLMFEKACNSNKK